MRYLYTIFIFRLPKASFVVYKYRIIMYKVFLFDRLFKNSMIYLIKIKLITSDWKMIGIFVPIKRT